MADLTKEEQERLGLYTHRFKALRDKYFWLLKLKEAHEHRKNTVGLESTPEEKAMIEDYREWAKYQSWNLEEQDITNEKIERIDMEKIEGWEPHPTMKNIFLNQKNGLLYSKVEWWLV